MKHTLAALSASLLLWGCASPPGPQAAFSYQVPPQPEAASGYTEKPGWATHTFAVAAANPLATDAGYQILRAGAVSRPS
jgi:gamma-glutamyltranspeptidase/glutathione hydrolase